MNIRKSIKYAMIEQDRTGRWLAEQLGVTPQYISRLQKDGSTPSVKTCERIATAFGLSVSEFIALGEK